MSQKTATHLRLPRNMLLALSRIADEDGVTMAEVIRRAISDGLDEIDTSQEYVKDKKGAVTFLSTDEFKERSKKAALVNGTSVSGMYVQMLSKRFGLIPCVVATKEEVEEL